MRMHGKRNSGCIRAHLNGKGNFRNEVTSRRTNNAATDHSFSGLIEDQLGESFTAAEGQRTTTGGPWESAFSICDTRSLGLVLGNPDPRHFRIGVGNRRNDPRIEVALLAASHLGGNLAFMGRLVR